VIYHVPEHTSASPVTEFLPIKRLESVARDTLASFAGSIGYHISELEFPLDAELLVRNVFGLDVHYDDEGVLDEIDQSLLGCLFPEGCLSPWGKDRLIAVNAQPRYESVTTEFTILHEAGHYVFHKPLDALLLDEAEQRLCSQDDMRIGGPFKVHPREWQASRFASEVLMPKDKVVEVLAVRPPNVVDLARLGTKFREYFGVSQAAMEKRLSDLGFKCLNGRYSYSRSDSSG
jgi:hypothetical protein